MSFLSLSARANGHAHTVGYTITYSATCLIHHLLYTRGEGSMLLNLLRPINAIILYNKSNTPTGIVHCKRYVHGLWPIVVLVLFGTARYQSYRPGSINWHCHNHVVPHCLWMNPREYGLMCHTGPHELIIPGCNVCIFLCIYCIY